MTRFHLPLALTAFFLLVPGSTVAQKRAVKAGDSFTDCKNCPEMKVLPAGSFIMGTPAADIDLTGLAKESHEVIAKSEGPQHKVTFARPFAIGKYEVTVGEFRQFVTESGYKPANACWVLTRDGAPIVPPSSAPPVKSAPGKNWADPNFPQTDRHPVVCITWGDASAYVAWLAKKTGKPYRLVNEAQWEYAARAGSTTRFPFGTREDDLCAYGNVMDLTAKEAGGPPNARYANCRDKFGLTTAPVGSFKPNKFGVHDMIGNVNEMVEDCNHGDYVGAPTDGSAWLAGTLKSKAEIDRITDPLEKIAAQDPCKYRAQRGVGFNGPVVLNRPGFRHWIGDFIHYDSMGFRVALAL